MSYLVFARKYRPQSFDEVVQQDHVTRTLKNAILAGRVPHALLFTGPRGTGKTTVARIQAKAMNCEQGPTPTPCNRCRSCVEITNGNCADVFEIDGASNNSVDQVRELRENLKYMPAYCRYKMYIIDEVHMLSLAAFNALLKTLEEPPAHVLFIFATTDPHKIPITILSRCQRHDLRRIDLNALCGQMQRICGQEGIALDEEGLTLIAREAGGSMRDALSLLDHVVACAEGPVSAQLISQILGSAERRRLFEFSAAVLARDAVQILEMIDSVWRQGLDMKRFHADLLAHFHELAVVKLGAKALATLDLPLHEIKPMQSKVRDIPESFLIQILDLLFQAESSIRFSAQPRLVLEMLFLKLLQTPSALSVDTLIERLDQFRSQAPDAAAASKAAAESGGEIFAPSVSGPFQDVRQAEAPPISSSQPGDAAWWDRAVQRINAEKPSLGAFLNKCRASCPEGAPFTLELSANEFTLKNIQKNTDYLDRICTEYAGQAIRFVFAAASEEQDKRRERLKIDQLKQKALKHPLVMQAVELFNGKVIDTKATV